MAKNFRILLKRAIACLLAVLVMVGSFGHPAFAATPIESLQPNLTLYIDGGQALPTLGNLDPSTIIAGNGGIVCTDVGKLTASDLLKVALGASPRRMNTWIKRYSPYKIDEFNVQVTLSPGQNISYEGDAPLPLSFDYSAISRLSRTSAFSGVPKNAGGIAWTKFFAGKIFQRTTGFTPIGFRMLKGSAKVQGLGRVPITAPGGKSQADFACLF